MDKYFAIGEPTRRSIIEMLAKNGQLSATDISHHFDVSASAISQHLRVLREANIVYVEKHGQQRIYQLDMNAMYDIQRWTQEMTNLWNQRFDRLDAMLKIESKKVLLHKKKNNGK